jgi:FkbH-like protein
VIGDDGVDGIVLGNGTATGEEFLEACEYIRELGRTGIILGVASKNDPTIAESVFREHREIPLKIKDFASFKATWQPKSVSLREMVTELNIGMDAVVYLDDNAAECEEVARACPEAIVLQVCEGADGIAQSLSCFRLFDRLSFTEEDANRAASYAALAAVQRSSEGQTDLPVFLASLDMISAFQPVTPAQIARTSQLFAKTNQFNLTQLKFSEQDLTEMLEQNAATCFVATLDDKFARHGLVSALTIRRQDGIVAEIVNWVMSCRVFNRTLEEFMLLQLREKLVADGFSEISARIVETSKNRHVQKLFGRLGFEQYESDGPGQTFRLNLVGEARWQTYINEQ